MAIKLETNIRECMDIVAPMKIISLTKKRAAWITQEILEQRRYRERLRAKARRTKKEVDYQEWKNVRRRVSRLVREGKKKYLHQGLTDQLCNSASAWKGIKSHLGWDGQVGPEALVIKKKEGKEIVEKLVNKPRELAEEMVKQYEAKNNEVETAIGPPIRAAKYLRCWTTARVKPIWKGKVNNKIEAKSFRPVALLPACGRIIEGLLAKQMDKYAGVVQYST